MLPKPVRIVIERFEEAWRDQLSPDVGSFFAEAVAAATPPLDQDQRRDLLAALIEVDLEFRRQIPGANNWHLDEYARRFPELGPAEQWPAALIVAEYQSRCRAGELLSHEKYLARFADRKAELLPELQRIDNELKAGDTREVLPGRSTPVVLSPSPTLQNNAFPLIEGYTIEGEIGRGGFGVVYKAREAGLERPVAIKVLDLDYAGVSSGSREVAVARFEAEARIMSLPSLFDHDHIVKILHVGHVGRALYLVLEFMEGGDLQKKLNGKPMEPLEAAKMLRTLASALAAAHAATVVHRDLKPANVLLDASGRAKLSDFGLAREADGGLTVPESVFGSPSYMSPEQAKRAGSVTFLSDIYSLGAILYQMLTGEPPFKGTVVEVIEQVGRETPRAIARLNRRVPVDLITICDKCMEKLPADRFATASDLHDELTLFIEGRPLTIRPPGLARRFVKFARRKPVVAGLYGSLAAASILGAALGLYFNKYTEAETLRKSEIVIRKSVETARDQVVVEQHKTELALAGETKARNHEADLRSQLARINYARQVELAYRAYHESRLPRALELLADCPADLRGWEWDFVHRISSTGGTLLGLSSKSMRYLAFDPDGRRVAVATARLVRAWDVQTGKELWSAANHYDPGFAIWFSADGRHIQGLGGQPQHLIEWDAVTGKAVDQEAVDSTQNIRPVGISDDGEICLTRAIGGNNNTLTLRETATGKEISQINPHFFGSAIFNQDKSQILTWSIFGKSGVFSVKDGEQICLTGNTRRGITTTAFGLSAVALGFEDGTISFWDAKTGEELWTVKPHADRITTLNFSPAGVLSASIDGSAKLLDLEGHKILNTFHQSPGHLVGAISPDGVHVVTASGVDGQVVLWNARDQQECKILFTHQEFGMRLAISADNQQLATSGVAGLGRIWGLPGLNPVSAFAGYEGAVNGICFSPTPGQVVTGGVDGALCLWDATSAKQIRGFGPAESPITAIAVSVHGDVLFSGHTDGSLRRWNVATGEPSNPLRVGRDPIRRIVFSPDGQTAIVVDESSAAGVYDTRTWTPIKSLKDDNSEITSAAWFPTGDRVVTCGSDASLKIWNIADGALLKTLRGHAARVNAVAITPDGQRIISGSDDKTAKVWDAVTGQEILTLTGHVREIEDAIVSPDGSRIVTASGDGTVRVWQGK